MTLNSKNPISGIKLGILGGGQLGKMLINAASQWSINTFVLDPTPDCPASYVCNTFINGNFKNYDDVYSFGQVVDILTIEIEEVNTDALIRLKEEGKTIYPEPDRLQIIKDKGLQKKFYQHHGLPSPRFIIYKDKQEIEDAVTEGKLLFPFVQKLCRAGYDGRGVLLVKAKEDIVQLLDGESVVEELVNIQKELSVLVARNVAGEIEAYPPVEMTFIPTANLVEFLICPAQIEPKIADDAMNLAVSVIQAFGLTGILAVEMFLDQNNRLLINEVAPRPHNSGHQTIEGAYHSQYEQHLRAVLGLPLGSPKLISPSVMVNLLGEPGYSGPPVYLGMNECLKIEGVNIHLYGKNQTRTYRKMGHATIIDMDLENAKKKAMIVKQILKIIS